MRDVENTAVIEHSDKEELRQPSSDCTPASYDKNAASIAIEGLRSLKERVEDIATAAQADSNSAANSVGYHLSSWDQMAYQTFTNIGLNELADSLRLEVLLLTKKYSLHQTYILACARAHIMQGMIAHVDKLAPFLFPSSKNANPGAVGCLKTVCGRLHIFAREMIAKHGKGSSAFAINNEYDLQIMLRGLLRFHFDNVLAEESTPSYLEHSSKIDFLLPDLQIGVEAKLASAKLGLGEIGKQLNDDIIRYRAHPDCKTLVCLIYDPQEIINNPRGAETQLQVQSTPELAVEAVIVQPGQPNFPAPFRTLFRPL